jgi:hypothetical protein
MKFLKEIVNRFQEWFTKLAQEEAVKYENNHSNN